MDTRSKKGPPEIDRNRISSERNGEQTVEKLVYLVTTDTQTGENMAQQISHFGYRVQMVQDFTSLENAVAEHLSVAILVDLSLSEEGLSDNEIAKRTQQFKETASPVMYISDLDDQATRLRAIRAGGVAFFTKPVDVVELIDKLDELNITKLADPYRVLVIEDQPAIANYYQLVLKMAGMATEVVTDPTRVLHSLNEFNPDLVLMDLYMPESDGVELTCLIRQIEEYVSTPIVFLSSEDDFTKQMEVMSVGADDFLTKPIKASQLVAVVKNRLERLRILRSYMVKDSLTGLLNHTSFNNQLRQEINRCQRQNTRLALAIMDLDHFKDVNDTYGHAVGDSVLKSLSRLLKQRLRKSDIIGRYGGEEFVAILLDADTEGAFQVLDDIRSHFSEVQHYAPNKGLFTVTFSCGIATFPEFTNLPLLSEAADRGLYMAKAGGRNRVVVTQA